jgi:hypothetical protein
MKQNEKIIGNEPKQIDGIWVLVFFMVLIIGFIVFGWFFL